jgi:LPS sulfotransferase NodH
MKALWMAAEVRSGSTYIAETLAYSFSASFGIDCWALARENFAPLNEDSRPETVRALLGQLYINQAGFRSSKLMVKDMGALFRAADAGPALRDEFFVDDCAWIVVRRRNKVRQAVSAALAAASGTYHYYGGSGPDPDSAVDLPMELVREAMVAICLSDDYLAMLAARLSRSITVYYEDFLADPAGWVTAIINQLRIPVDVSQLQMAPPKLTPTSQSRKADLEQAFADYFLRAF